MCSTLSWIAVACVAVACGQAAPQVASQPHADTVLLGGRIVTVDERDTVVQALAVRDGRIQRAGSDAEIRSLIGPRTRVVRLQGKTVVPGLIESHVHSLGVATEEIYQPYAEISSIAEVQNWVRWRASRLPAGRWIKVPRTDITRLKERRHPTPAELDAACDTHPVVFTAARKHALNSLGFRRLGITRETSSLGTAKILRDAAGNPVLIFGGDAAVSKAVSQPQPDKARLFDQVERLLRRYNEVGITSIVERGLNPAGYRTYRELHQSGRLTARVTAAMRLNTPRADQVARFAAESGLRPRDGDDWVRVGPLKIVADGGIHWGNTFLSVPYGPKRIAFYRLDDPEYRGDFLFTGDELAGVIRAAHSQGWQMSVHVTGDAGVDRVLDALEAAQAGQPARDHRFTLLHAYFPSAEAAVRARRLGVVVDTQPYLYYKDSPAIAEVYGREWAERLIGVGDWVRNGVPAAISSDHMIGMDPDHAMNSFNPFLMAYIAVSRRNQRGNVVGESRKISRLEALRALTYHAAYLTFAEGTTGSLEPGKFADLAVLDRDYLSCPEEQIREIQVLMTMAGGRIVYERK